MNAANQIKSLAEFDLFFIEEAATVSMYSWETLLPTLRKPGSELWAAYNPITVSDPITVKLWNAGRDDALLIEMEQGRIDNPWWTDELQKEMEEAYKQDPDEAEHIWGGKPRAQGHRSVLSRRDVSEAMERTLTEKGGKESLGIDVARFGGDLSVIVHRRGNQVLSIKEFSKVDTQEIARIAWDMINRNPSIPINTDDTGVGGGVSDKLKDLGALVNMVHFGGSPIDRTRYTSCADEMWFTLPIQEMVIPPNQKLLEELTTRQFSYTQDDRKKIESKDVFKKRLGRSPDTADALVLAFYEAKTSLHLSHADREAMRLRNAG
jgi:phage terminase large subunit